MTEIRFNIYVLQVIMALGSTVTTYLLKYVIDTITTKELNLFFNAVVSTLIFVIIFYSFRTIASVITEKYIQTKMLNIRYSLFKAILFKPPYMKSSEKTGDYNALIIGKVDRLETEVIRNKILIVYDLSLFCFTLIAIMTISLEFMFLYVIISFIIYFVPLIFHKFLVIHQEKVSLQAIKMYAFLQNTFTHVNLLFNINGKKHVKLKTRKEIKKFHNIKYKYKKELIFQENLLDTIGILTQIGAYLLGGLLVMKNELSYGELVVIVRFSTSIYGPIVGISQKRSIINSFKEIKTELALLAKNQHNDLNKIPFDDLHLENIEFEDIIKDFTFEFSKNTNYQFIGNSGAGKSIMTKLISGEKMADDGKKLVNGQEIMYPNCCLITQETMIIEGTIKENILFDQRISNKEFMRIIKILKIDEFYEEERILKNNDQSLSYGQKQRINIARALVHKFDMVIFDEALNGLQTELKHDILDYFADLNTILIIIAHDFTIKREDFITIDFNKGKIEVLQ